VEVVKNAFKEIDEKDKEVFGPLREFYKINIEERFSNDRYWR